MIHLQNSEMYWLQVFISVIGDSINTQIKTKNNLIIESTCDFCVIGRKAYSHNGPDKIDKIEDL